MSGDPCFSYTSHMKYLGIDYGTRTVGVAVSDGGGTIAFPRAQLHNDGTLIESLLKILSEERIESVVVGDTRALNGAENPITAEAEKFIAELSGRSPVPVQGVGEAFTSVEAGRYAPDSEHNDASAAAVILQRYLDMKG